VQINSPDYLVQKNLLLNFRFSDKEFRWPLLGFIALWMTFHTWALTRYYLLPLNIALWDAVIFNMALMSAALGTALLTGYLPKAGNVQITIVAAIALAMAVQWISQQALVSLFDDPGYLTFLQASVPVRWALAFIFVIAAGMISHFNNRLKEWQEAHAREAATQVMVREAELQKLQLQLQPHFLFNSLNSINALILGQPEKAGEMVQQLSDFLRATIRRADEKWITLAQEIDYLQLYLSIEKVRFGHRLEVRMDLDEQIHLWLIPPLLLQPLVENAIKFGLYGTTGKVVIHLHTRREDDHLQVEISNPFDEDMQPAGGSGFGLSGLRRRLYLLYARNDLLTSRIENNNFIVCLTLPEKNE
jgi:two-component system, LytTR family, sensor kinase